MEIYDTQASKKPTNLSLNTDLLKKAKALHINLSKVLELALLKAIKKKIKEQWLEENNEAITQYNESIRKRGMFSEEWRRF